jgi:hypothetical protein
MSKVSKFQAVSIACGAVAATAFGGFAQSASAAEEFNNQNIQFERDTIIEFEFLGSKNRAQSTFGVVNLSTGEKTPLIAETRATDKPGAILGSPSRAVRKPFAEYTFQSNTPYAFYLESKVNGKAPVTVYSTPEKNGGSQLAKFDNDVTALGAQGIKIAWNDGTSSSRSDFDQFTVIAGGGVGCPCKASPALTAPLQPEPVPARKVRRAPPARG